MQDYSDDDVLKALGSINDAIAEDRKVYGKLGYLIAGRRIYDVNGRPDYMYVTLETGTVTQCINTKVARLPINVELERLPNQKLRVIGPDQRRVRELGANVPGLGVGVHSHRIGFGNEDVVEGRRLEPGLVWHRPVDPSLVLYVEPLFYRIDGIDYYWPGGTIDLTDPDGDLDDSDDLRPSTSNHWRWVKIGIDTSGNSLYATGNTSISKLLPLDNTDLAAITFTDYIPLLGLKLRNGQTDITDHRDFVDCRPWVTGIGGATGGTSPADATYVINTADPDLPNAQVLDDLTGNSIVKVTSGGLLDEAIAGTDYLAPFANQSANQIFAGPSSGGAATPAFRSLVDDDIPAALTLVGGSANNMPIGGSTPAAGAFTTVTANGNITQIIATKSGIYTHANTDTRTYTFPDVTGTVALTSDITTATALAVILAPASVSRNLIAAATATIDLLTLKTTDDSATKMALRVLASDGTTTKASITGTGIITAAFSVVTPRILPVSNGTNGILILDAAGSNIIANVDTTNKRIAIGGGSSFAPSYSLHVKDVSGSYVAGFTHSTTATNSMRATAQFQALTSNAATDGFGTSISFDYQDSAAVNRQLAIFGAIRNGAANSGKFIVSVFNAGVGSNTQFTVDNLGITTLTAVDAVANAVTNTLVVAHNGGTVAAGFGTGLLFQAEASSGNDITLSRIRNWWTNVTNSSGNLAMRGAVSGYYNTGGTVTEKDILTYGVDGSGNPLLSFFTVTTPITQPANTVAINDVLVNLGFRASGGVSNFTTNVDVSTVNIVTDTSTGTKIATATGQKLGFWNANPVVQQVLATGAAHTVDDVITLLQTLGLCKQS